MTISIGRFAATLAAVVGMTACGAQTPPPTGGSATPPTTSASPQPTGPSPTTVPGQEPHVMVIMEENQSWAATLGSCAGSPVDPYLCSLAKEYASLTNWVGIEAPYSLPNYFAIDSGSTHGCTDDGCSPGYTAADLGGQLTAAGIPWVAWMESMPSPCYTGGDSGNYVQHHNPFVYFTDVTGSPGCSSDVVPYPGASAMVSSLDGAAAPDFVWITPNVCDDMHTQCGSSNQITVGDDWLASNLPGVLHSSWLQDGGTIIITMDNGPSSGNGGTIPEVVISANPMGKGNLAQSGNHYGTLRSIEEAYGLSLLGAASDAANGDLSPLLG